MDEESVAQITGAWDYADLPDNITIGTDCFIERRASFARFRSTMKPGLTIGDRVSVYTWTEFNVEPTGQLHVGDNSVLVGAVFMCADRITIGARVLVSYNVTIADSDFHPRDPDLRRQDAMANAPYGDRRNRPPVPARPVVIEDDVQIGIGAIILKGVTLGRACTIGAGAVVTRDVAAGARVVGNPARPAEER